MRDAAQHWQHVGATVSRPLNPIRNILLGRLLFFVSLAAADFVHALVATLHGLASRPRQSELNDGQSLDRHEKSRKLDRRNVDLVQIDYRKCQSELQRDYTGLAP